MSCPNLKTQPMLFKTYLIKLVPNQKVMSRSPIIALLCSFIFLFACKKDEPVASCSSILLVDQHKFDSEELGYQLHKIKEMPDGNYFASAKVGTGLDYKLIKINASFEIVNEFLFEGEKIHDFDILNDGRLLISSRYESGMLSIISEDFSSIERLELDYITPPTLKVLDDEVLVIAGSGVYSTEVIRYDSDFVKIWRKTFGPSRPYTHFLVKETGLLYIATEALEIIIMDVNTGSVVKTLDPKCEIQNIYVQDDYIYLTGVEGPIGNCERQIFAIKLDMEGNRIWHAVFGSPDSDDWGSNIIVHNDKVYVGGSYAKGCSPGQFGGSGNFYVVELSFNGEIERCYLEHDYPHSGFNKFYIDDSNQLIAIGAFSYSEVKDYKTIFSIVQ